jgi:tetratricopeptide (TPR) repeat protein
MKIHRPSPTTLLAGIGIFSICALFGLDRLLPPTKPDTPAQSVRYIDRLRELDAAVVALKKRTREKTWSWTAQESLALAYLRRASFGGEVGDYAAAAAAVERAFALAPPGAGPFLTRARVNAGLHRIAAIADDLAAAEQALLVDDRDRRAIALLRGDTHFFGGRYGMAEASYRAAVSMRRGHEELAALARLCAVTGRPSEALTLHYEAISGYREHDLVPLSWLLIQRGQLHAEQAESAQSYDDFARAAALIPGWWFADARVAGARAVLGDAKGAISAYELIIARAPRADVYDAVAGLYAEAGDADAAANAGANAESIHAAALAADPDAAAGHALAHALRFDLTADRALALAERNCDLRPYGEAQIALAEAYRKAGREDDARSLIAQVAASGWNTPKLARMEAELKDLVLAP